MKQTQYELHRNAVAETNRPHRVRSKRRIAFQLITRGERLRTIVLLIVASVVALGGYKLWLLVLAAMFN